MADPEAGAKSAVKGIKQTGSQQETGSLLRNLLHRISERSPTGPNAASLQPQMRSHGSADAHKLHAQLNSHADVLGKGCAAQVSA